MIHAAIRAVHSSNIRDTIIIHVHVVKVPSANDFDTISKAQVSHVKDPPDGSDNRQPRPAPARTGRKVDNSLVNRRL